MTGMDEQRGRASTGAPPGRTPGGWQGTPWWRFPEGAPRRPPWLTTLALVVFIQVGTGFAAHGQPEREPVDAFARVLLLAASGALLLRHRHPVAVAYATAGTTVVYLGAGYPYGPVLLAVAVGVFAAVVAGHRHAAWGAVGVWWAGQILVTQVLYRWLPPGGDGARAWGEELVVAVWVVATMAVSELARTRREQGARERAERALAARRRADEERLRIARELHDVLAHSISVINVQAGVGLALLDSDPEQARTALTTIKAASKEALGEVRQVLDTLRPPASRDPGGGTPLDSGAAPRAPAPGLARLPELVEQAGAAGLAVTVATEGRRAPLPPGTDLAAFRIVQEALTNVVRHSGSRRARVLVRYAPGTVTLRVDDDGPATGADAGGSGNGLAGMRERAAALRGTIEAGPRPNGGFRVTAVLPTAGAAPRDRHDDE
ncbi:sensor histidine kinase [Streptomyces longispororuber]|uniref:sensor histidine kinase n=1 Tax=Streptomyces longispororuber TaxID=68230 RepID=UPI0036FE4F63